MRKGQELLGVHICIYKKIIKKCFGSGFQGKFFEWRRTFSEQKDHASSGRLQEVEYNGK